MARGNREKRARPDHAPAPSGGQAHSWPKLILPLSSWATDYSSSALPLIALCGLVFFLATLPIWTGVVSPKWDADMLSVGPHSLLADCTRSFQLLLWSPWTAAGTPFSALSGAGSFSPLVLFLSFLWGPTEAGFRAYWLSIWLLGLVGMIVLARHFKTPNWICVTIALGYAFSGIFTGHAEHLDFVYSMGLLPWCIWTFDRVLVSPTAARGATAGLVLGLFTSGSYPGIVLGSLMLYLVWALSRLLSLPKPRALARSYAGKCMAALAVAAVISALLTLPPFVSFFHESPGYSARASVLDKSEVLNSNPLTTAALATFLNPYFANLALLKGSVFAPTDVSSVSVYLGFTPLVLLLLALCFRGPATFQWSLAAGAAFFFLFACSTEFPVRSWLYELFPPSRYFRHSSIFRIFTVFLLFAIIASRGDSWNSAFRSPNAIHRGVFVGLLLALVAVSVACHQAFLSGLTPAAGLEFAPPALAMFVGMSGLILASALTVRALTANARSVAVLWLLAVTAADAVFTGYLTGPTLFWRGSAPREKWDALNAQHRPGLEVEQGRVVGRYRNDNLLTKKQELANYSPLKSPYWDALRAEPILTDLAIGENRWWFAPKAVFAQPSATNHARYLEHIREHGSVPLVVDRGDESASGDTVLEFPAETQLSRIPAQVATYTMTELELTIRAPQPGWLLVTDRWTKGWTAEVDGTAADVGLANFLFRAVEIPAGDHRVAFQYRIGWLIPYLVLSCIAFLVGVASAAWEVAGYLRRRDG